MKKIFLSVSLFFTLSTAFSQSFMNGVGITSIFSVTNKYFSFGGGFTYSPRFNFAETEKLSVSVGVPLTFAVSVSTSTTYDNYYSSYYDSTSVGFTFNAPLLISLNVGRGSSKENREKFGFFIGDGYGYHHGSYLVEGTDAYGYTYVGSRSVNTNGPAGNAGVRFGVGRKSKNIELRFSYMKGLTGTQPDIFGIAGLFNF
jgi:hypothetical protein